MPVVKIYGLPETTPQEKLQEFCGDLTRSMSRVKPLALEENMITFLFPKDLMMFGLGEEIIIFVDGLFTKPQRTDAARKELAQQIGWTTKIRFPDARVECFVRPFDPTQGFWSSKGKD